VYVVLAVTQVVMACLYPMAAFDLFGQTFRLPVLPCLAGLFVLCGGYAARRSTAAFSMGLLLFTILYLVVGVLCYAWYMTEIAGLFFAMGLAAGLASGLGMNPLMRRFMEGVKDMLEPAMIIGLASGIIFILREGKIIDTLLYSVSYAMSEAGEVASLAGMYLFQTLLNVVMPSGSAKAALTMPIMAPLSDLLHISRQTTVLAFQFGDGCTNMITPTSGILMGVLGAARIPYTVWLKWVYKFILFCIGLGFLLLLPTLYITFNGF
ncbi:MAG: AbgT family transporter, partial [Bacteroidales bacterium]|nr:AbgT family transporter [Bacteroidales bacterium]